MNIINGFVEYVAPNTSPRTLNYVKCEDMDRLKQYNNLKAIPEYYLQGKLEYFGMAYYSKPDINNCKGNGTLNYFLKAPELVEYWSQFTEFLEYCTKNNIKWFFKESHMKKISECTNKHYLIELGNTEALKDFK